MFTEEIGKVINEQLEKNESLKNSMLKIDINSDEIHKLYESILEIRRISIDDKTINVVSEKEKKNLQREFLIWKFF